MKNNAKWRKIGDTKETNLTSISLQTSPFFSGNFKILPLRLQKVAKGVEIKCKIEIKKLTLMAQYCRKEIKLFGYETNEMSNREHNIKL